MNRLLTIPEQSFFLFGPRGVGKSTWLKQSLPKETIWFDLLETGTYLEFSRNPGLLEAKIGDRPRKSWICIDEVQKVPLILDEVHRLIEHKGYRFALSGSSARKLKRDGANLLAGRAVIRRMGPFCSAELGKKFSLKHSLEWGTLPLVSLNIESASEILTAYVYTYIKEEIKEEGLVRRVEPFLRFLEVFGMMNAQILNSENIARDARIPRSTVDVYFSILEDTLMAHKLPAYRPRVKAREQAHPKFYWFDPGVARGAAGLLNDSVDSVWLGTALETLIFQELRTFNETHKKHRPIFYYRTGAGAEIDFVIETRKKTSTQKPQLTCIEVKYSKKWDRRWESAMRSLSENSKVEVSKMIGVYMGNEEYTFDGVQVLPVNKFLHQLYAGDVF